MLHLTGINKTFFPGTVNERRALVDVDLELKERDFVTVIGSNGAGKSTLLNIVSGSIKPDTGSVEIDGRAVTKLTDYQRAAYIGRVFQNPSAGTAPHMTIEENLAIAYMRGKRRGVRRAVAKGRRDYFKEQLASLEQGLEDRLDDWVGLLSGGQRQSLSLLMATFTHPKVLLLDEHTAALDPQRAASVTKLTVDLVERHSLTTLMVTHNMEQALSMGNRLIMMHEGSIIMDVAGAKKKSMTVKDLLTAFSSIRGAELSDRTLLS
ncbi:ABC transporter ATP-binding protein [Flaviflexus salsibiostraticola]|uniref:ABC transporter ATP-binding protein n=1 Tax=Flaviflexus salsibiostraticola TaxID=1282737 RepID=A0A3Q8WUK6_9ACTO|nr:ABC transporter ATP-binding protein [Flaviflexus salsibiostraticola]AZN30467.1 ABC transporter ATP-binding protein [Flaviflexus salsibiostraticola]